MWERGASSAPMSYERFEPGEPNGSGDCVRMRSNGQWGDRDCAEMYRYVCERE